MKQITKLIINSIQKAGALSGIIGAILFSFWFYTGYFTKFTNFSGIIIYFGIPTITGFIAGGLYSKWKREISVKESLIVGAISFSVLLVGSVILGIIFLILSRGGFSFWNIFTPIFMFLIISYGPPLAPLYFLLISGASLITVLVLKKMNKLRFKNSVGGR